MTPKPLYTSVHQAEHIHMDAAGKLLFGNMIFTANLVVTDGTPLTVASPSNSFGYNAQPQVTISGSNTFLSSGQTDLYHKRNTRNRPIHSRVIQCYGKCAARDKCDSTERRNKYNNIRYEVNYKRKRIPVQCNSNRL